MLRKNPLKSLLGFLIFITLASCSQTNDVVSNGWIQKRKHRQGFHIDLAKKEKQQENQNRSKAVKADALAEDSRGVENPMEAELGHSQAQYEAHFADANTADEALPLSKISRREHSTNNSDNLNLSAVAEQRTEELEELREAQKRNDKNLTITGILSVLSLVAIIGSFAASLAAAPLAILLGVLGSLGSTILRYSLPLLIIYLFERMRLKKGEIFFTPERIEKFTNFASGLKMTQLVTAILGVLLGGGTLVLFYMMSPMFILTGVLAILAFGVASFVSWLGIVTAIPVTRRNTKARNTLIQLIAVQLLAGLMAAVIALIFIYQFLIMLFN